MPEIQKRLDSKASPERRRWRHGAIAGALAVGTLATGFLLHRDGPDPKPEAATQATDPQPTNPQSIDSHPNEITAQSIEGGTDEEKERPYREEINTVAQNLVGRVANFNNQTPEWVVSENNTAQVEVRIPSHTADGQEASFRLEAEVDLGPDGQPDVSKPRQVQVSMEQGADKPPIYEFELVKLSGDVPFGEWGLFHNGLAGTPAGHPDGTDQTLQLDTLRPPSFTNGLDDGNYLDSRWLEDATELADHVIDAAQAGDPVDPGLVAL